MMQMNLNLVNFQIPSHNNAINDDNTVPAVWCEYSPQFTYFFKTWKFLSNLHLRGIKVKSNVQKIFKFHVLKRKLEKSFTKP